MNITKMKKARKTTDVLRLRCCGSEWFCFSLFSVFSGNGPRKRHFGSGCPWRRITFQNGMMIVECSQGMISHFKNTLH
jgi:hypothetical protein